MNHGSWITEWKEELKIGDAAIGHELRSTGRLAQGTCELTEELPLLNLFAAT